MTKRPILLQGMPAGMRGPHVDSVGPCNDTRCRKCDPVRAQMRRWAEKKVRVVERRRMLR
jgi:hypothetical protein